MKKILLTGNEAKIIFYCTGLIIIMSLWLILRIDRLSDHSLIMSGLLILFGYAAMVFDIKTKKIPNMLILIMIAGWLLINVPILLINKLTGIGIFRESMFGFLIGGGLFLLVYIVSSKGLGGGDVKFMASAGLYLGFSGTITSILYGTVLAALIGLFLIIIKKIGRKDSIPLAPFLFAGILITFFTS